MPSSKYRPLKHYQGEVYYYQLGSDHDDHIHGKDKKGYQYKSENHRLAEKDFIEGKRGDDFLYGNRGGDALFGGNGDDTLYGGNGHDYIAGGLGSDRLHGGAGRDTFHWRCCVTLDRRGSGRASGRLSGRA